MFCKSEWFYTVWKIVWLQTFFIYYIYRVSRLSDCLVSGSIVPLLCAVLCGKYERGEELSNLDWTRSTQLSMFDHQILGVLANYNMCLFYTIICFRNMTKIINYGLWWFMIVSIVFSEEIHDAVLPEEAFCPHKKNTWALRQ